MSRLVLDLRNNGGGLLQGGVQAANTLLPPGNPILMLSSLSVFIPDPVCRIGKIVVFVVPKDDKVTAERTLPGVLANASPLLPDLTTPLDVLVNRNTASAAEVLAAALKVRYTAPLPVVPSLDFDLLCSPCLSRPCLSLLLAVRRMAGRGWWARQPSAKASYRSALFVSRYSTSSACLSMLLLLLLLL